MDRIPRRDTTIRHTNPNSPPANKNDSVAMMTPPIMVMVLAITASVRDDYVLRRSTQALCPASYAVVPLFAGRAAVCLLDSVETKCCRAGFHLLQSCPRAAGVCPDLSPHNHAAGWRTYAQNQSQIDLAGRSSYQNTLATEQTAWKRFYLALSRWNRKPGLRSSFAVHSTFAHSRRSVPSRFRMSNASRHSCRQTD